MLAVQRHRGPDGQGVHADRHVVLGHCRLAILDLSDAGRQPMSNQAGTVWVTYNGEIYNFRELRAELAQAGYEFRSKTDTEVLIHGYEAWGIEQLLTRLRGMFAFALYDQRASGSTIYLVKDRFGIKPLYYSYQADTLVFASEVRACLASGVIPPTTNPEALLRFLQFGSVPMPVTTIKNVHGLQAGHYMTFTHQGATIKRYWDLRVQPSGSMRAADPVQTTRRLLSEAVSTHLVSDVPVGVFLSGGTDSSALVALASGAQSAPVTTLSMVFNETEYNEATYARVVAAQYQTQHHERPLSESEFMQEWPMALKAMDQPSIDGLNTYWVSRAAKQVGLTVVLSGLGGDEVFLGYHHFRKARYLQKPVWCLRILPRSVRTGLVSLAEILGRLSGQPGAEKLAYLNHPSAQSAYLLFRGLFAPNHIRDLMGLTERETQALGELPASLHAPNGLTLLETFQYLDFSHFLQNQLLKDADVMSMAHSIETRVPFLDHPLAEYVAALPTELKLRGPRPKALLVDAMGSQFPRAVWDRPKQGFTFPFATWLRRQSEELEARCLEGNLFDRQATAKLWADFRGGRVHWSRPWALVVAGHSFAR